MMLFSKNKMSVQWWQWLPQKYFEFIMLMLLLILWWLGFPNTCLYMNYCKKYLHGILCCYLDFTWEDSIIYILFCLWYFFIKLGLLKQCNLASLSQQTKTEVWTAKSLGSYKVVTQIIQSIFMLMLGLASKWQTQT